MGAKDPPIKLEKLKSARKYFRALFDSLEMADVEITDHFQKRQRKWGIDLAEVNEVLRCGHIRKEYKPDMEHISWRWSLCYKGTTLIFTLDHHIVFITCWKGKEPKEGER